MTAPDAARPAVDKHLPLAVLSVDGMPFVHCSCRDDMKPQTAVWLSEHWQGTEDEGVAALDAVVARQRSGAPRPAERFYREPASDPARPAVTADRKIQLSPAQLFTLDLACQPLRAAFKATPYLVGTVNEGPGYRDVDVRMILKDKQYDRMSKALGGQAITFLGFAISAYLRDLTGLPIDFQFQRLTEANEKHKKPRNPLGSRTMMNWPGDARPTGEVYR